LVVYTDHKPLTFVLSSPSLSSTVHGWFDELSEYNFKVIHRPGILNVVPDALSRMYAASYADTGTWGVARSFNMSNIELINEPLAAAPKDVTGPLPKTSEVVSLAPVSLPMGEGAANISAEENENKETTHQLQTGKVDFNKDFDLLVELDKRGMTMPSSEAERKALVEAEHAVGHFGIEAIYKSLHAKHIWWPNMRKTITSIVQDCHACNVFTVTKTGYNPSGYIHASGPWEHIQVDTVVVRHSPHVFCMFSLILMCCLCVLLSVDGRCLRQSDTVFFPLFLCCLRLSVSFVQSDLSQRQSIYICVSVCLSVDRSFVGFGQLASC